MDQLHKALRGKAPANSLAAVVAAARPSAEENALVAELREQVEEQGRQLQEKVRAGWVRRGGRRGKGSGALMLASMGA